MAVPALTWQPSLFCDLGLPRVDLGFGGLERLALDESSWVDYAPLWVAGADRLFANLVATVAWGRRRRWMYGRQLDEPRLTAHFGAGSEWPAEVEELRAALSQHYGVEFDSVGLNLYRDGQDSVAWHGDHIAAEIAAPIVALVSLGDPRPFRLRPLPPPAAGRSARTFHLGCGDLLVTGGLCQRQWQHSVPKVARAGPRISLAFRHGAYVPGGR